MSILDAITLGVVQGLTEFLPISSSGHLILARELFGIGLEGGLAFDAMLHFATACAVLVYFHTDIRVLVRTAIDFMLRRPTESTSVRLLFGIVLATIPAVILGVLLEDKMNTVFRSAELVATMLVIGSLIMWAAEKWARAFDESGAPAFKGALAIGFFQSLALIPGMSRSGMSIAGGMFLGLRREHAARFGFLIAVPLLLGAGAKKIADLSVTGVGNDLPAIIIGAAMAFAVGLAVIHYLMRYLRTHSMMVFVWYRLALAAAVLTMVTR